MGFYIFRDQQNKEIEPLRMVIFDEGDSYCNITGLAELFVCAAMRSDAAALLDQVRSVETGAYVDGKCLASREQIIAEIKLGKQFSKDLPRLQQVLPELAP